MTKREPRHAETIEVVERWLAVGAGRRRLRLGRSLDMSLICGLVAFLCGLVLLVSVQTSLSDGEIAGIGLLAAGAGLLAGPVVGLVRR